MGAEPGPPRVQRYHESVRLFQLLKHLLTARAIGELVSQRARYPLRVFAPDPATLRPPRLAGRRRHGPLCLHRRAAQPIHFRPFEHNRSRKYLGVKPGANGHSLQATTTADYRPWPQAALREQWPGTGRMGDPYFGEFRASQIRMVADGATVERLMRHAGRALLERLAGPSC
jgi:hypothetical protein